MPSPAQQRNALSFSAVDLVGTAEVVKMFGVAPSTISRWRRAGKMPEPVVVLAATPVWNRRDIEAMRNALPIEAA